VHVKDVLSQLSGFRDESYRLSPATIKQLRRDIIFAPPSMRALDLLLKMQATHTHLALVIDEYGGTDGLVSIEDIVVSKKPKDPLGRMTRIDRTRYRGHTTLIQGNEIELSKGKLVLKLATKGNLDRF
jgi:hypothetical protein